MIIGSEHSMVMYHGPRNLEAEVIHLNMLMHYKLGIPLTIANERQELLFIEDVVLDEIEEDKEYGVVICEIRVEGVIV